MPRVVYPRDLAVQLHAQLAARKWESNRSQEDRKQADLVRALPSVEHTAEMLDVAYVTSLHEEESQRVRCTFAYLSPEAALGASFAIFPFPKRIPFEPSTLAKLAPATQVGRSAFGVWDYGGTLEVWGLVHHGDQSFAIDLAHTETYFALRILRAGAFVVHFDDRVQLLFSRDHGHFFTFNLDLLGTIRDDAGVAPKVANTLVRLAQRMLQHGHGGTILVVREGARPEGLKFHASMTSKKKPDQMLASAMRSDEAAWSGAPGPEGEPPTQQIRRRMRLEKAHEEALDFVARLTAIDGALVLDTALGLLGAGATIQTSDDAMPESVFWKDPRSLERGRRERLASVGGNRHRSAVCFCAQQPWGLALVASQDGDLSLIARSGTRTVRVVKPYELGVGL